MTLETIRKFCLSLPHATEDIQWENDLLFRVGRKMFAVACLDPAAAHHLSFKCAPGVFAELIERDGIIPAPYMARHHWVALDDFDTLGDAEIRRLVKSSYEMVFAKLPAGVKKQLSPSAQQERKPKRSGKRAPR